MYPLFKTADSVFRSAETAQNCPIVHINGTAASQLMDSRTIAIVAIQDAIEALKNCAPNRRDYVTLGGENEARFKTAHKLHMERFVMLEYISKALQAEVEAIDDQVLYKYHNS